MNGSLMAPISEKELQEVVFYLKQNKAPGPSHDGFPTDFYQRMCHITSTTTNVFDIH